MNLVLYHAQSEIPEYTLICIQQFHKIAPEIPIYLITDRSLMDCPLYVTLIATSILRKESALIRSLEGCDYFRTDDYCQFPWGEKYRRLFRTSLFRFAYIHKLMREKELTDVLHFDNDVLVYENPLKYVKTFQKYDKLAVTPQSDSEICFGFSYVRDVKTLEKAILPLYDEVMKFSGCDLSILNCSKDNPECPNEMQLFNHQDIDFLPVLPMGEERFCRHYAEFNSVFDCSSYGQYLGGASVKDTKPGFLHPSRMIDSQISSGNIEVEFENGRPWVIFGGKKISINNLHIASKRLKDFV